MVNYIPPALLLSVVIAALYGAVFHLLWGRDMVGLPRALGIAVGGFLMGELMARMVGVSLLMLGDVHLGVASAVAWVSLAVDYYWRWEL